MTAGALALWIGMAFAALATWAGSTARPGDPRSATATRGLAMGALFCCVSLGLLLDALRRGDLAVDFVARHTTLALPVAVRLLAIGADASGAGLLAATLTLAAGAWVGRRGHAPGASVAAGVASLVLLAAPLAGRPHAMLPWMPVDGQEALPVFRERMALPWVVAMALAVPVASVTLGRALDAWRGDAVPARARGPAALAAWLVAAQGMTGLQASLASGVSRELSPILARDGTWSLAFLASLVTLALAPAAGAPARARVVAAVAQVLACVALVLSPIGTPPTLAVRALLLLAVVVAGVVAWEGRVALLEATHALWSGVRQRRLVEVPPAAALGCALLAVVAGLASSSRAVRLPSGGTVVSGGATLAHLGVSRYDLDDATVLALALERRGGTGTALASAEQREYTDARGSVLGTLVRVPARFPGLVTTVAWLDRVAEDDGGELTVATRPDGLPWWVALALLALHVTAVLASGRPEHR